MHIIIKARQAQAKLEKNLARPHLNKKIRKIQHAGRSRVKGPVVGDRIFVHFNILKLVSLFFP